MGNAEGFSFLRKGMPNIKLLLFDATKMINSDDFRETRLEIVGVENTIPPSLLGSWDGLVIK